MRFFGKPKQNKFKFCFHKIANLEMLPKYLRKSAERSHDVGGNKKVFDQCCLQSVRNRPDNRIEPRKFKLLFEIENSWIKKYLFQMKEFCLGHTLKSANPYIFGTGWCNPAIFQTYIIWSNRNPILKYLKSTTLVWKDIGIRKSEFVKKTQVNYKWKNVLKVYSYLSYETMMRMKDER